MSDTIHHVPGRLRIRMAALRRNPRAAVRARRLLGNGHGVLQVQANPLTGSLLVLYDPERISGQDLLDMMAQGGFAPPRKQACPTDRLADAAVSLVVDKLVARGAAALLAAII